MKTDAGVVIRATAQDREMAKLMGINVRRIYLLSFGMSAALVASAGLILTPT